MKRFIVLVLMAMLLTACNGEKDIDKYNAYQKDLETHILDFVDGDINEDEFYSFLDEFAAFVEGSSLDEKAVEYQLSSIELYKKWAKEGNDEFVEEAAKENYVAVMKINHEEAEAK